MLVLSFVNMLTDSENRLVLEDQSEGLLRVGWTDYFKSSLPSGRGDADGWPGWLEVVLLWTG